MKAMPSVRPAASAWRRASATDAGSASIALDGRERELPGHRDRREPLAAADVGDAAALEQAGAHVRHRVDPAGREVVQERGAVDVPLAVAELAAVGRVGDAAAGAIRLRDAREHAADAGEHVRERGDVRGIVGVDERARMLGRQVEAALAALLDVEQPGDGLLLEPFTRVARRDAGVA